MGIKIVSVDSGRSGVKVVGEGVRDYFRARQGTGRTLRLERRSSRDDLVVEYAGTEYFIGDLAKEAYDDTQMFLETKVHPDTKLYTLTAIHKVVDDGDGVFLVSGMPIANHTEEERARFRKLLVGSHEITVNGLKKSFDVVRVEVAAECATVGWSLGRTRADRFHVVDVGSRTVNFCTVERGRWIDRLSGSLDFGAETEPIVGQKLARKIIGDLSRYLRPLSPIILIGGCASALAEHILNYHEQTTIHEDALFANAMAFRELGVLAYEQATRQREA